MIYRIERSGALDLEFDGELLADVSSRLDKQPRWTTVRIYRTSTGRYVTEVLGQSEIRGERERREVHVVDNAPDVIKALHRKSEDGTRSYLTKTALDALDEAATKEPSLRPAERI
jgi:hypothetical protein